MTKAKARLQELAKRNKRLEEEVVGLRQRVAILEHITASKGKARASNGWPHLMFGKYGLGNGTVVEMIIMECIIRSQNLVQYFSRDVPVEVGGLQWWTSCNQNVLPPQAHFGSVSGVKIPPSEIQWTSPTKDISPASDSSDLFRGIQAPRLLFRQILDEAVKLFNHSHPVKKSI